MQVTEDIEATSKDLQETEDYKKGMEHKRRKQGQTEQPGATAASSSKQGAGVNTRRRFIA